MHSNISAHIIMKIEIKPTGYRRIRFIGNGVELPYRKRDTQNRLGQMDGKLKTL